MSRKLYLPKQFLNWKPDLNVGRIQTLADIKEVEQTPNPITIKKFTDVSVISNLNSSASFSDTTTKLIYTSIPFDDYTDYISGYMEFSGTLDYGGSPSDGIDTFYFSFDYGRVTVSSNVFISSYTKYIDDGGFDELTFQADESPYFQLQINNVNDGVVSFKCIFSGLLNFD